MKIKMFLLLVILGIVWQDVAGQQVDSLLVTSVKDSIVFDSEDLPIDSAVVSKELIIKQIDSLTIEKQSLLGLLSVLENQIDSLYYLIGDRVEVTDVVEATPPVSVEKKKVIFLVKSVSVHQNSMTLVFTLGNLKNSNILLFGGIDVYDGEFSKDNHKGSIPFRNYQKIDDDTEIEISFKIEINKKQWKSVKNFALKANAILEVRDNDQFNGRYEPTNQIEWEKVRKKKIYLP